MAPKNILDRLSSNNHIRKRGSPFGGYREDVEYQDKQHFINTFTNNAYEQR